MYRVSLRGLGWPSTLPLPKHPPHEIHRELVVAVDVSGAGGDFGLGKVAHRVAHGFLVGG